MNIEQTSIKDLVILNPTVFEDSRGYFFEAYNQAKFEQFRNTLIEFVQDNQSFSKRGVIEGIAFAKHAFCSG